MKLKLIAAALLATAAFSASAADAAYNITLGDTFEFDGSMALLEGGSDTITFSGLAAGVYNVLLSYQGNNVSITSATLNASNGQSFTFSGPGGTYSAGGFSIVTGSPFTLVLNGTETSATWAQYHGAITVTAVPEPATYGMLAGGLGLLGLAARRKSKKQS